MKSIITQNFAYFKTHISQKRNDKKGLRDEFVPNRRTRATLANQYCPKANAAFDDNLARWLHSPMHARRM